jgi:putative ABC transport system permease protein
MLALHRTISFRYLRQRWPRAVLVVASIALGVATLVATRALNEAMKRGTRGAVTPLAGFGELLIGNGDQGVERSLLDELRRARIDGVRDVQPLIVARLALSDLQNRSAVLLGVDVQAESRTAVAWGIHIKPGNPLGLLSGHPPAFVGTELAQQLGDQPLLRVRVAGGEKQLAVAGIVDAQGPAATLGGRVVIMPLDDAARLLGRPRRLTRIDLSLEPGTDREVIRQQVDKILAGRALVGTPEANDQMVRDVVGGIEMGFSLGGLGALIVGLFLVYNALSVSVAERWHDIGILRSVGATRRQVAWLFAGEAGLLGLTGACLGIPLGKLLAVFSAGHIHGVLNDIFLPLEAGLQVPLTFENVLVGAAAGVFTALLAALVPALQAAREEPAAAVRRVPQLAAWHLRLAQVAGSVLLIALGCGCYFLQGSLPARIGTYLSVSLILIGGLLALPVLTALAAGLLQRLARPWLGIEGRLAVDNLARSPGRTGLVIGALAAGTALLVETAGLTLSSEEAVLDWIERAFVADLVVTANSPIAAGGDSQDMPEEVGRRIALHPGVESVPGVRFRRPFYRDKLVFLIAIDARTYARAIRDRGNVPGAELYPLLCEPGTVLISENFAARHDVATGQVISLPGRRGPWNLRVIGTVVEYSWNQGSLIVDREQYKEEFDDPVVDAFDVFLQRDADGEAVRQAILRKQGAEAGLVVMTRHEVRQTIADMIHRLYSIGHAQQVVVMLVAGLGVVMALLISVLQRRRELGLLRAVGASQAQVLRSVLTEAALMGLLGALLGVALGIPLEWYAVRVILFEETGIVFPLRIPWAAAGTLIALGLGVALVAGLLPAIQAMRLRITEAIAYE